MTDRFTDLQKQGFMRPLKRKVGTLYEVWLPDGEGRASITPDKWSAELLARTYPGSVIRKVRGVL